MKTDNKIHTQADALLAEIARLESKMAERKALADQAVEQVLAAFKLRHAELEARHKASVKALKHLASTHMPDLFDGADRVDFRNGALLLQTITKVTRARAVTVPALEDLGFPHAVKIAKSVNWDLIETWPDEKLVLIGTQRTTKTKVEYELRDKPNETKGKDKKAKGKRQKAKARFLKKAKQKLFSHGENMEIAAIVKKGIETGGSDYV